MGILCVGVMLWAALFSPVNVAAQSPAHPKPCVSFHEVHRSLSAHEAMTKGMPSGYRVYPASDGELLLRVEPVLNGAELVDAQPNIDVRSKQTIIYLHLNKTGAARLAKFSSDNVGQRFAIVVDGRVVIATTIREPLLGGQFQISESFTPDSAAQLATQIRSGDCS